MAFQRALQVELRDGLPLPILQHEMAGRHPPSPRNQTRAGRSRELHGQESDSHPTSSGEAVSLIPTSASDSNDPARRRGPSRRARLPLRVLRGRGRGFPFWPVASRSALPNATAGHRSVVALASVVSDARTRSIDGTRCAAQKRHPSLIRLPFPASIHGANGRVQVCSERVGLPGRRRFCRPAAGGAMGSQLSLRPPAPDNSRKRP